jgi:hypothetical protein
MRLLPVSLAVLGPSLAFLIAVSELPETRAARPLLPLTFAHADHIDENCVACHHEFVDGTIPGAPCLECHDLDPAVAHLVEVQFHDLCRGCHVERAVAGQAAGPVRDCHGCHVQDEAP